MEPDCTESLLLDEEEGHEWKSRKFHLYSGPAPKTKEQMASAVHLLKPLQMIPMKKKKERRRSAKFELSLSQAFESPVIRNMFNTAGSV